jgi:hypothetical protein
MLYQGQGAQVILGTQAENAACYGAIMLINHRGLSLYLVLSVRPEGILRFVTVFDYGAERQ